MKRSLWQYPNSTPKEWQTATIPLDTMNSSKIVKCFGCYYLGGKFSPIKGVHLEALEHSLYSGLQFTDLTQHSIYISELYETTIRSKVNEMLLDDEEAASLPAWPPELVQEHLELHVNDPQLNEEFLRQRLKQTINLIWRSGLIQKEVTNIQQSAEFWRGTDSEIVNDNIQDEERPTHGIHPQQWKIVKEMLQIYLKLNSPEDLTTSNIKKKISSKQKQLPITTYFKQ